MNRIEITAVEQNRSTPQEKEINGLLCRLNPETEAWHPVRPQEPGEFGSIMAELLRTEHPLEYSRLLAEGSLTALLLETEELCSHQMEEIMGELKQREPEPEDYLQRVQWLNRLEQTAREQVVQELTRFIPPEEQPIK